MTKPEPVIFSFGKYCKDKATPLELRSVTEIFEMVIHPDEKELVELTKNLRSVLRYSKERYRYMKTQLPFFSCSLFEPQRRSVEYFKSAHGLVIDIDLHNTVPEDLIKRFKNDPRILMGYVSPSNMGIKLVFYFDKPIENPALYTYLYKRFSVNFAQQYHLADCIDPKNSDVSRISFLCHDVNAWFQDDAVAIDVMDWSKEYTTNDMLNIPDQSELPPSTYKHILQLLDTRPKNPKTAIPVIQEINDILPDIEAALGEYGIQLKNSESIQYGAKIKVIKEKDIGELNVYYGRQGYKVVSSPRKGTHHELNEVTKQIIEGVVMRY